MTKEKFLNECAIKLLEQRELEKRVGGIKFEIAELERQYVAEHREFHDGEKVLMVRAHGSKTRRITLPLTEEVFISSAGTLRRGDIFYGLRQVKKDGTMSSFKADGSIEYTLKRIEP